MICNGLPLNLIQVPSNAQINLVSAELIWFLDEIEGQIQLAHVLFGDTKAETWLRGLFGHDNGESSKTKGTTWLKCSAKLKQSMGVGCSSCEPDGQGW